MAYDQKSNLPSYEESVTGNSFQDHRPDGQRILDQLTTVRAQHIRSTVNTQIYPIIERRAERGLSQTVLALIPSNIMAVDLSANPSGFTQEESSVTAMELLGLVHHEEDIEEVRLQGEMNHFEFWKQKDVVQDLQRVLQERLTASPIFSFDAKDGGNEGLNNVVPVPAIQEKGRGFFGRRSSKQAVQPSSSPTPVLSQPPRSRLEAKVDLEEVCLRTVSSFGLYETITKPAIVVRVNIRC